MKEFEQPYQRRTPKKKRRGDAWILVVFAVVALVIGLVIVMANFSPSVPNVGTDIPFDTGDPATDTHSSGEPVSDDERVYKRKEGVYNFLLVGYDKAAGLTDVNMLAQFDTNTGAVNIVQMPRDTYARYNERENAYHKINGALSYFDRDLASFANFLQASLCLKIDYYGSVDLAAFRNIVDLIGGVEINIAADMDYDDPEQDLYIHLKAGRQVLDGAQAEQFVRFRKGYIQADIGRTNAQKLFMTAFIKQFQKKMNVSTLTQVGTQMLKYADTNLTLQEYVYFATKVLSIDLDKITMMTLPGSDAREYQTYGAWYYVLSRSAMLATVNEYLNVYTRDITDKIFDPNLVFTNPKVDYMNQMYRSEGQINAYAGDEIDENGIYIPRTKTSQQVVTPSVDTTHSDTTPTPDTEDTDVPDTEPVDTEPVVSDTEEILAEDA